MIDNEGFELLVDALCGNSTLKSPYLAENPLISPDGWQSFSRILQSKTSVLTELHAFRNVAINDEVLSIWANSLGGGSQEAGC